MLFLLVFVIFAFCDQSCRLYSKWQIAKASNLFFKLLKYSLNLFCAIMNYFLFKFTLLLIELSDLLILDILKLNLCNYAQYCTFFPLICLMNCDYVLIFNVINVSFVTKISLLLSPLKHYQSGLSCFWIFLICCIADFHNELKFKCKQFCS